MAILMDTDGDSDSFRWLLMGILMDTDGGAPRENEREHQRCDPTWTHCMDSFCYLLENPIAKCYWRNSIPCGKLFKPFRNSSKQIKSVSSFNQDYSDTQDEFMGVGLYAATPKDGQRIISRKDGKGSGSWIDHFVSDM